MRPKLPPLSVDEVVALAKRKGQLSVNPLRAKKDRITNACFRAAERGLLRKERINCGRFIFYPVA